jgi:hypothetical protein
MSTGFAAKKRCIYLTVSLLENDVPQTLRAIVRTVFVPTPQFRCVVFFLRSYPSRQRIDLITYKSIQSTADTTRNALTLNGYDSLRTRLSMREDEKFQVIWDNAQRMPEMEKLSSTSWSGRRKWGE